MLAVCVCVITCVGCVCVCNCMYRLSVCVRLHVSAVCVCAIACVGCVCVVTCIAFVGCCACKYLLKLIFKYIVGNTRFDRMMSARKEQDSSRGFIGDMPAPEFRHIWSAETSEKNKYVGDMYDKYCSYYSVEPQDKWPLQPHRVGCFLNDLLKAGYKIGSVKVSNFAHITPECLNQ